MKRNFLCAFLLLSSLAPLTGLAQDKPAPQPAAVADYLVGPGDVLSISVWKDESLTQSVPVRPDGKISFPLVGEISAGGKSVPQIKEEIEKKIARYVPDPTVSVGVQAINSLLIYVIGRVNSPGRFVLNNNINVLQALATAGGCNPFADTKNIKVLRKAGNETQIMDFNYNDVSAGKGLDQNIVLERGDVIVVP